jgi:osmoprotectant transport system substrate-binding protein
MTKRRIIRTLLIVCVVLFGGCYSSPDGSSDASSSSGAAITVGSFDFAESKLLAELYSQAMEKGGFPVRRAFGAGPREFVAPAFAAGLLDFLPEYAGTALQFATLGDQRPVAELATTYRALVQAFARRGVTVLDAAPAQDANVFVVRRTDARRHHLQRVSDLAGIDGRLTFGGPPECERRPLCLAGLERTYGLQFKSFVSLDAGGPLTHEALDTGAVDVALLFTTDPALEGSDLVALADDRALQPAENVTPLVRSRVIERAGPGLAATVNEVSRRLTTGVLRDLNAQVGDDSGKVAAVAARWLEGEGLA